MEIVQTLPLRVRSVEVAARIAFETCGDGCLLALPGSLSYAVPCGLGPMTAPGDDAIRGALFGTPQGTFIKNKAVRRPSFGRNERFSESAHRRALDILRDCTFDDVCRPERECLCSWEFRKIDGAIAWTRHSMSAPRCAELFPVHPLDTREDAVAFVKGAWRVLEGLNRRGISHGDPTFYNFLIGDRITLIDLDECIYTGEAESLWDQSVFLHSTMVPVLAGFMTAEEIALEAENVLAGRAILRSGVRALIPAIAHSTAYNGCARLVRSLAMQNRALNIQLAETDAKLSRRLEQERRSSADLLRVADERGRELEAAHAEMKSLRKIAEERRELICTLDAVAAERLTALQQNDPAMASLQVERKVLEEALAEARAQLQRAVSTIEEQHQRAQVLEAAAAERLAALQRHDRVIIQLNAEVERAHRELARLRTPR